MNPKPLARWPQAKITWTFSFDVHFSKILLPRYHHSFQWLIYPMTLTPLGSIFQVTCSQWVVPTCNLAMRVWAISFIPNFLMFLIVVQMKMIFGYQKCDKGSKNHLVWHLYCLAWLALQFHKISITMIIYTGSHSMLEQFQIHNIVACCLQIHFGSIC